MASRHQQPPSRRGGGRGRSEPQTNARTAGEREGVSNAGEPVSANTSDRGPHANNAGGTLSASTIDEGPRASNAKKK